LKANAGDTKYQLAAFDGMTAAHLYHPNRFERFADRWFQRQR
jgi:hypothetical protein